MPDHLGGEKMRIFVTGATGFIGTRTVRRMAQTDNKLCCLIRKTSSVHALKKLGVTLVTGDITDPDSLSEGMKYSVVSISIIAVAIISPSIPKYPFFLRKSVKQFISETSNRIPTAFPFIKTSY